MLIAHLPAGYLTGRALGHRRGIVMAAALVGSVFPDFDMIWFLFIDNGAIHHHRYWVHAPGFWLIVAAVTLPAIRLIRPLLLAPAMAFLAAIAVHLLLDSIGGGIMLAWPFSSHLYTLVEVPADNGHWIASFILHWSFWAEVAIILAALTLWIRR